MLTKRLKTESVKRMPFLLPSLQKEDFWNPTNMLGMFRGKQNVKIHDICEICFKNVHKSHILVLKPDHLAGRYVVTDNAAERGGNPCAVLEALPLIFGSVVDKQVEWCESEWSILAWWKSKIMKSRWQRAKDASLRSMNSTLISNSLRPRGL